MNNSDLFKLFAECNRKAGYEQYANTLDNAAAGYEAEEILNETKQEG